MKLQRDKEEVEKQMRENEKIMTARMMKLQEERQLMELRLSNAATTIQKMARGMIARVGFKRMLEEQRLTEKQKLSNMLNDLKSQIKTCFNVIEEKPFDGSVESYAIRIQRAVRKMLARKRFRLSLYKLMLIKNIIENKVHKEKMQMLYAFEQMIINTEDENDQDYYDEGAYGDEAGQIEGRGQKGDEDSDGDSYGDDDDADLDDITDKDAAALAALQYYQRHKQFPPMQRIPVEAEYMSNPSDVIDEEEFEDSETDPASPLKKATKLKQLAASVAAAANASKPEETKLIPFSLRNQRPPPAVGGTTVNSKPEMVKQPVPTLRVNSASSATKKVEPEKQMPAKVTPKSTSENNQSKNLAPQSTYIRKPHSATSMPVVPQQQKTAPIEKKPVEASKPISTGIVVAKVEQDIEEENKYALALIPVETKKDVVETQVEIKRSSSLPTASRRV